MPEVFPFPHNWRDPYRARIGYRTNILVTEDDTEQRRMVRLIPAEAATLSVTAADGAEPGWLDALLYHGQTEQWAVPSWPDASTLLAAASPGSDVELSLDTVDRGFQVGADAILHLDPLTTELVRITAVEPDSITVEDLVGSWPARRTQVAPAALGRLSGELRAARPGHDVAQIPLSFDLDLGVDPGVATPGGPVVFSVLDPNPRDPPADRLTRSVIRHSTPSAGFVEYAQGATPIGAREQVLFSLTSRAEIAALRTWFHGLKGALTPFWWPTWYPDLRPVGVIGGASLTIVAQGYTARHFPHEARRHLGFVPSAGGVLHRRVTGSVDNGNGTETLTLNATVAVPISYVCFLLYVRAGDDLELAWSDQEVAEARLTLTELPRQVPTSV